MGGKRNKKNTDIGILEPMIDLVGAVALGAYTKHKIKKAYKEGRGEEAAAAATAVYGMGGMHKKGNHIMEIAGLHAVQNAVNEAEREKRKASLECGRSEYVLDADDFAHEKHNNRYAWRMNCEEGSKYGLQPEDFETRDSYHDAFCQAQAASDSQYEQRQTVGSINQGKELDLLDTYVFCRVSRLDNGSNEYFLAKNDSYQIGEKVLVNLEEDTAEEIVLSVEKHTIQTAPQPPQQTWMIIKRI